MITLRQGDTLPVLTIDTGTDLSSATDIRVLGVRAGYRVIERALGVDGDGVAKSGQVVTMTWQPGDSSLPGLYEFFAEVTTNAGVQTFGPVHVNVVADADSLSFIPAAALVPVPGEPGFFMIGGSS